MLGEVAVRAINENQDSKQKQHSDNGNFTPLELVADKIGNGKLGENDSQIVTKRCEHLVHHADTQVCNFVFSHLT